MNMKHLLTVSALMFSGGHVMHAAPVVINGEWYSSGPIPGDFPNDVAEETVDSFANSPTNEFGGTRYVYLAGTCFATPSTGEGLPYNPYPEGWWDVDGNGTCAKFAYQNLTGGRYGNIASFDTFLTPSNESGTMSLGHGGWYTGLSFYAACDNPSDDWTGVPMGQVNILANINPASFGGHNPTLGAFWHIEFPLRWDWTKYYVFFKDLKPPANNPSALSLPDQVTGVEFQQSNSENAVTSKYNTGTIYVDHLCLFVPWNNL